MQPKTKTNDPIADLRSIASAQGASSFESQQPTDGKSTKEQKPVEPPKRTINPEEEQKKWSRIPMSTQVKNWIIYYSDELSHYTDICYFKNKIFWTAKPYWTDALRLSGSPILDVAHAGMVVLNLDNVARGGVGAVNAVPAWEGLWTGVRPMSMCVNDERMFIMSKDSGSNELYEVLPDESVDRTDEGHTRQITSIVYTRVHFVPYFLLTSFDI